MKAILLILFAAILTACGEAPATTAEAAEDGMDGATSQVVEPTAAARAEATTFLQQTVEAVQGVGGDITSLSPEVAANNVNGWITKLSKFEGTEAVVGDLADLKKQLLLGDLNADRISEILTSMAGNTRDLGDRAPGLNTLADVLQAGSDKLAGK